MPALTSFLTRGRAAALLSVAAMAATPVCSAADALVKATPDAIYPALEALYLDLHRHPELSLQEEKTAAKMAAQLRKLGLQVTEKVGGHGVVGVLRNGDGPTVMVRTDMDALPIKEQTGLPYASTVVAKAANGETTPVMHACGHDIHMTSWVGAAMMLAANKAAWRGTVVFVGQPAEEILQGAKSMLKDGLLTRFPKPDFILGLHVSNLLPAGKVGIASGPASAASNAVDITFYGKGGHGAVPHLTKDPILIAARAVVTLQSIVSREVSPFEPAIVTVGTFNSGSKRNVIPDEAKLELTVRSYKSEVQQHMLEAITRIAKAEAAAAGASREPLVFIDPKEASDVVINDPALAARLNGALNRALGEGNALSIMPASSSEDFGDFGQAAKVPSVQLRIGAVEPKEYAAITAAGKTAPGTHTANFAPDREPTIRTGAMALAASVMELLRLDGRK